MNSKKQKETNSFLIKKEILYQYFLTGNSSLQESKTNPRRQNAVTPSTTNVNINPEIIEKLETLIKLPFVEQDEKESISNVCFANSLEVRDDFKNSFSAVDVLHYAYAVFYASAGLGKFENLENEETFNVVYPTGSEMFWKVAELGKKLRQEIQSSLPSNQQHDTSLHNILCEIRTIIK